MRSLRGGAHNSAFMKPCPMPSTLKFRGGVQFAGAWRARLLALAASCLWGLGWPAVAQAPVDTRIALVIGNGAYGGGAELPNPGNDAQAMGDSLRQLGFTVVELRDGSKARMDEAIVRVRDALKGKQGVGMLYYAGHGLQLDWRNYMVPVDAQIATSSDVPVQAVDVGSVIDAFKAAGNRMNILVLDACRDNPFATSASGKGLAPLDAPPGTFFAFATAPGNVAEDGDVKAGNGLYTGFLLQELKKPAARIEDVFKRVRLNVRKQSQGRQVPWESTSLEEDFVFNSGQRAPVAVRDEQARDAAFRIEKADWDKIRDSSNADDYYAFLLKYPSGSIAQNATAALERLAVAKVENVADRHGVVQVQGVARYRVGDEMAIVRKDMYTGLEIVRGKTVVTRIADGIVEINNGMALLTIDGATIKNQFVKSWDPPRMDYPGDAFAVGKKWESRSIETPLVGPATWREDRMKIVAFEDVTTAAGTFKAFKFELNSVSGNGTFVKLTYWAQPDWPFAIKTIREIRPRIGPATRETTEMVSRKRGAA
jgi:hypothetical protein